MPRRSDDCRTDFNGDYRADRMYIAGRDQINVFDAGGIAAIQATGGIAKLFVILGLLITYAGAAMFGFVVVSFIVTIWSSMGSSDMPDMSSVSKLVVPWLPLGIGLVFVGSIVASIALAVGRPRYR
jgi:hypothetical protein